MDESTRYRALTRFSVVESGCWEWDHADDQGYGTIRTPGGMRKAHRVVYEILVGPIPAGLTIDHLCRNRRCVNPAHLEPVTSEENVKRSPLYVGNRTHCPRSHEYTDENTRLYQGRRFCRQCDRDRKAARRESRRVST